MPVYRYKALDVRGDLLEGQMEAASEAEVAARLQEQGHVPVEASLSNGDAVMPSLRNFLGEKPFSGLGLIHSLNNWRRCSVPVSLWIVRFPS